MTAQNDCTGHIDSASETVTKFTEVVTSAKAHAKHVILSSICPQIALQDTSPDINIVNADLQEMCTREDVQFIDNSSFFFLNDGYFLHDGQHLSKRGSDRLAKNLKLNIKDPQQGVCGTNSNKVKRSTNGQQHMNRASEGNQSYRTSHSDRKAQSINHKSSQRQSRYEQHDSDKVHCYNCYETNHNASTCRWQQPLKCYRCGETGHKEKHHHD